jgi:hypothetical protein
LDPGRSGVGIGCSSPAELAPSVAELVWTITA